MAQGVPRRPRQPPIESTAYAPPADYLPQRTMALDYGTAYYEGRCLRCQTWRLLGLYLASRTPADGQASQRRWSRTCWYCRHHVRPPSAASVRAALAHDGRAYRQTMAAWAEQALGALEALAQSQPLTELQRIALCHVLLDGEHQATFRALAERRGLSRARLRSVPCPVCAEGTPDGP